MAINNTKVLFQYGLGSAEAAKVAGALTFDASAKAIYVGDGSAANLVTSAVKDATFTNKVLTVSKVDGTAFTLDFSDVASAEGVNSLLATLRTDINTLAGDASTLKGRVDNHDTSLASLNTAITNLDASYKAADASLKNDLVGDAAEDYNTLGKLEDKIQAEADTRSTEDASVLQAAKEYADTKGAAATTKVAEGTDAGNNMTIESSVDASGATTYTINLTDVASASAFAAHDGSVDIHVTADQKTRWTNAAAAIEAFKDAENIGDAVVDTLKEIQDYITSDASAADKMTKDIAAAQSTANDASAAAAAAQADVDALEEVVGEGFSKESTVSAQLSAVKATADAAATAANLAKTDASLKSVMDSYVISFGGAKGAVTVKGGQAANGSVNLEVVNNELKASIVGIGTAAFEASTAFDAAGAAAGVKDEVTGTADDAADKVTLYGVKAYADALKADADSSIDALQTLVGSDSVSSQISAEIAKLDSTLDATEGKYVEKVVIVDGKIDATASVVKSLPAATVEDVDTEAKSSNYVSIATTLVDKKVVVTPTVTLQDVSTAGTDAKGLAEASDVKAYVDNQISANALAWTVLE